jgi:ubiquinone/menaquinone biosynthesis C-methylase UbiE
MEEKYRETYPKMVFRKMDALNMNVFQDEMFDTIFDKGTLDAVMCSDNFVVDSHKMISEVYRILKPGGRYICITYGDPEHRKKHFEIKKWEKIVTEKIQKPATSNKESKQVEGERNFHYLYILTKKKEA